MIITFFLTVNNIPLLYLFKNSKTKFAYPAQNTEKRNFNDQVYEIVK